jgi:putative oxidoreductase
MLRSLLRTTDDITPTIARLTLALFILPHGLQKTLGLFGGYGVDATMGFMTGQGIPAALAATAIAVESVGGVALLLGLGGRLAAAGLAVVMAVAAVMMHRASFFVGQDGGGFELHLLAIGLALIVMVKGSGRYSVDGALKEPANQRGLVTA